MSNETAAIKTLVEWVNSSHSFLSNAEGYSRGYRDGLERAKEIVESILNENGIETTQNQHENSIE